MTVLLVALGAAVGAPLRYVVQHRLDGLWPTGTLVINVAGSFLLGLLVAASVSGNALALLGTGFCGGLTTYSGFAVRTTDLVADPKTRLMGWTYAAVTIVVSLGCVRPRLRHRVRQPKKAKRPRSMT